MPKPKPDILEWKELKKILLEIQHQKTIDECVKVVEGIKVICRDCSKPHDADHSGSPCTASEGLAYEYGINEAIKKLKSLKLKQND